MQISTAYALRSSYIAVCKDGVTSYGGSQRWSADPAIRKYGCGVIACADLQLYLQRSGRPTGITAGEGETIPHAVYDALTRRLKATHFHLIPGAGLNCFLLVLGLNRIFRAGGVPLRASWGVRREHLWPAVRKMLDADIPVILCIGHNFPKIWEKHQLSLYQHSADDYRGACAVKSHYVTATAIDGEWLRISSWGREYYIRREEFSQYMNSDSNGFLSNIVYIKETGKAAKP